MGEQENSESEAIRVKRRATFRICNVSSFTTEILEIPADNPALHVLVIPGNPGVVSFYKDFVESLYELLGGTASVTAVGHISHTKKVLHFAYTRLGHTRLPFASNFTSLPLLLLIINAVFLFPLQLMMSMFCWLPIVKPTEIL
ncbi:hypothetical protein C1H46_044805 [Malus baccata]|uniref:Uncharacterized protein n=1 Tax=Malus baccata TaxID=106549 RepID=A0A540K615_MALBA|nr:hypothetical protein C1H46_044805 [Malus baccata]